VKSATTATKTAVSVVHPPAKPKRASGCTGDCHTPHYCGDGTIDGLEGKECDPPAGGTGDASCKVILGLVN